MPRAPVHIIGGPLDLGAPRRGVDVGPSALRIAGIDGRLATLGYDVVGRGNLAAPIPETKARGHERKKYIREIARVWQRLFQTARASYEANVLPVVLGGDHSLAAGSVTATIVDRRRGGDTPGSSGSMRTAI